MSNFFTDNASWGMELAPVAREVFRAPTPAYLPERRRSQTDGAAVPSQAENLSQEYR